MFSVLFGFYHIQADTKRSYLFRPFLLPRFWLIDRKQFGQVKARYNLLCWLVVHFFLLRLGLFVWRSVYYSDHILYRFLSCSLDCCVFCSSDDFALFAYKSFARSFLLVIGFCSHLIHFDNWQRQSFIFLLLKTFLKEFSIWVRVHLHFNLTTNQIRCFSNALGARRNNRFREVRAVCELRVLQ